MANAALRWHPAACIFPMLPDDELQDLADDIAKNGLREDILIHDGLVLDGRNRLAACRIAQVEPRFSTFHGTKAEALALVWSKNRTRRHLDSSQAAVAEAKRAKLSEEYAAEVQAIRESQAKGGRPKKSAEKPAQIIEPVSDGKNSRSTDHKRAKAAGTNRTYIKAAEEIVEKRPDLAEQIEQGKLTIPKAKAEIKRQEKAAQIAEKAAAIKQLSDEQPVWTLIQKDVMDGLKDVRDHHGPARLIVADPPYNIGVDYGDGEEADSIPHEEYVSWCKQWLALCHDCLTDDGSLWVITCDEVVAETCLALKFLGLHIRNWIKWYETFGVNCQSKFNRTSRHILYATVHPRACVWNPEPVTRASDRQAKYGDKRAAAGGKIWDDVWQIPRLSGSCWERIPGVPTQLPLALIEPIVACSTEPGDLVVDPFNGSGTTGVACKRLGRKYIGIDKSAEFIDIAEKRLVVS